MSSFAGQQRVVAGEASGERAGGLWGARWGETVGLVLVLAVAGVLLVPAHWTSLWGDREFTGWCAPIADRIADGARLYVDGTHIPMPPLSFLTLYWLFGHPLWIDESLINFVCQALLILTLFLGLSRYLPRPAPILAALLAVPIYLQLPKTILYDAEAQLFAALALVAVARVVETGRGALLAALASALCLMTKQSTAAGLIAGAGLSLLLFASWMQAAVYAMATAAFAAALVVAVSPWVDPAGFVSDVLVLGSEPKGGTLRLLANLQGYGGALVGAGGAAGLASLAILFLRRGEPRVSSTLLAGIAGAGIGLALALKLGEAYFAPALTSLGVAAVGGAALTVAAVGLFREWLPRPLAAMTVAAFAAALAHTLSVAEFRWTYDNNPLVMIVFAVLVARLTATSLAIPAVVLAQILCWTSSSQQIEAARDSTVAWPEVRHLDGARLRPRAEGMRDLVARVRELAGPGETVLMLPEDPNVQMWFDRPRPALSSAIVFVDQYWDRFVDDDLQRLERDPPKVVVLPPPIWRRFGNIYNGFHWGSLRLGDLVRQRLLASAYGQPELVHVTLADRSVDMEVYALRPVVGAPNAATE